MSFRASPYEIVAFASEEGRAIFPRTAAGIGDIVRNTETGKVLLVESVGQLYEIHPDLWSDWFLSE